MAIYTVHVPRGLGDATLRAERTAFVRDGFSGGAFLYGPLYFLRHGAWLAALGWIVAVALAAAVNHLLGLPLWAEIVLALMIMLFTGLEAGSIRRLALGRRGLQVAGVVRARNLEESEAAFFATELGRDSVAAGAPPQVRPGRPAPTGIIGLFPDGAV